MDNRATEQLQTRLDGNDFNVSELISIKIPAKHLTYYNCSSQFVRVNGQIEIRGLQYSYVKRRLYNDSIELLCIPNQGAMHLTKVRNDYYKLVNDLQNPGQDKKSDSHVSKSYSGDFYTVNDLFRITKLPFNIQDKPVHVSENLPDGLIPTAEHPPQTIS